MTETPAYVCVNADSTTPVLLLCDHASNVVPDSVSGGDLGLPKTDMNRHIAYDVGAEGVTRRLADHLGATALLSRFSRLVIDPNRGEDDPTLLMKLYDGSIIPANAQADAIEAERRLKAFYRPYHNAITARLDAMIARGLTPLIVSIHSFTPKLRNRPLRPWHVGILWDKDPRIAQPLIQALNAQTDICVGDNEPYSGQLQGDTMYRHGTARGLPHALIEVRNDLIETEAGQTAWADRLAPLIADLDPTALHKETRYG